MLSLSAVPTWARLELAKEVKTKIVKDKLEAKIPDLNSYAKLHNNFPVDLYIKGAATALAILMPFIYHWLQKKKVKCEITEEDGKITITVSGYDAKRVINVKKIVGSLTNEKHT